MPYFCSKNINKLSLSLMFSSTLLMSGCTITNVTDEERLSAEQIDASVKEWQAMKPEVARLMAMEKELTELKGLLLKLTEEPVIEAAPMSAVKNSMPEIQKNMPPAQKMSQPTQQTMADVSKNDDVAGQVAIQIGAFASTKDLVNASGLFYQKFSTLSNTTKAYSEEIDIGRALYRLKIGPFISKGAATSQCEILKSRKMGCLVTSFKTSAKLVK